MEDQKVLVGDFETTVYSGQTSTEVWASAVVELHTEDVHIFHSIDETFLYLRSLKTDVVIYYHNLKFDGNFWLSYLLTNGFEQAYDLIAEPPKFAVKWQTKWRMKNNSFRYMISDMGQWYDIIIKVDKHYIEIRDSLKLLPFTVKRLGDSFKTKHKKLEMEYTGYRYAGCEITDQEKEYIGNDVLVVKEALEIMFEQGHSKLTIGSCCMAEYKKSVSIDEYQRMFPDLTKIEIPEEFGSANADEYIRKSYRGGWCYLVKGKEGKVKNHGTTADVNSLYPSMMSSESGNAYPVGTPTFWKGNFIPDECYEKPWVYFFVRIRTRFYIKAGKLPFIQIKNSYYYKGNEMLESSDIFVPHENRYVKSVKDKFGTVTDSRVILTLTMTDYKLFLEQYEAVDFEILDGCMFVSQIGIFDDYINKYKEIKIHSKGAVRESAKLFLNNLYGKMASSTDSSFKVAFLKDDGVVGFRSVAERDKKAGYIAVGSAITSYARNFTIRAAQQNYYGADNAGFIYADTDSIHCDLPPEEIKGIKVHDSDFCCWKLESCWDYAIFTRQKTYIEHVTHENLNPIESPYLNIKCAGMPQRCKDLLALSLEGYKVQEGDKFTVEEKEFLATKRELKDFDIGLKVPSKLMPVRIKGGVLLMSTTYEMRF